MVTGNLSVNSFHLKFNELTYPFKVCEYSLNHWNKARGFFSEVITRKLVFIKISSKVSPKRKCVFKVFKPMIDLLLRNNALSFQNTLLVLKGLSDFHKLVLTVLKTSVEKNEPWEIRHRRWKFLYSRNFKEDFSRQFSNSMAFSKFGEIFVEVSNRSVPLKYEKMWGKSCYNPVHNMWELYKFLE